MTVAGANPYAPSQASTEPTSIAWDALPNEADVLARHHSRGREVCALTFTDEHVYLSCEAGQRAHRFDVSTLLPLVNVLMLAGQRTVLELRLSPPMRLDFPREALAELCDWLGPALPDLIAAALRRRWRGMLMLGSFLSAVPLLLGGSWYAVGEGAILVLAGLVARFRPSRWAWALEALGYLAISVGMVVSVAQGELSRLFYLFAVLIALGVLRAGNLFLFFSKAQSRSRRAPV